MTSGTRGFTLIELLIVIGIVGILTMIAYPTYVHWILKANRSDAISTLAVDQTILERCYAQTFAYNGACASLPAFPQATEQGYYTITLSNLTATTYTLTATTTGTQTRDTSCQTFSVDEANQKTATDDSATAQTTCWD